MSAIWLLAAAQAIPLSPANSLLTATVEYPDCVTNGNTEEFEDWIMGANVRAAAASGASDAAVQQAIENEGSDFDKLMTAHCKSMIGSKNPVVCLKNNVPVTDDVAHVKSVMSTCSEYLAGHVTKKASPPPPPPSPPPPPPPSPPPPSPSPPVVQKQCVREWKTGCKSGTPSAGLHGKGYVTGGLSACIAKANFVTGVHGQPVTGVSLTAQNYCYVITGNLIGNCWWTTCKFR